ncbi:MAG TPA: hypothetical protein VFN43_12195 [Humibacillus sp.]|nr:hypothetical protein [Humibacillus sp.]
MKHPARVAAALSAGALVMVAGASSSDAQHSTFDVTAVAIASSAHPDVTDESFDSGQLGGRSVSSDVSAGANTNCDECDSAATSLGIVYAHGPGVTQLDNLAGSTTAGCTNCKSVALSVQIVVVRRPGSVIANNRAVAVNAECVECRSSAVAYQFVAVVPGGGALDRRAVAELRAWVDDQAAQLRAGAGQRSMKAQTPPTADVEAKIRSALGSVSSLTTDVDIQVR